MSDDPSVPQPTPPNYQRTTGGDHLRWQPPTPEHLQEMLPAYEILSILGQGGMGAVYKGRQKSLDRVVAIKILPPEAAVDDMQFVERFKNEARTMAKMNHPAIVHVYDFGETSEGQLYIVMEFIDGTDVAKMIQSQGRLPEDHALSIAAHVCDALGYAHTQSVVHRDIKPANILINMEGQVKVADFGLAKATDPKAMGLTQTNMTMGTPDFVSPEALTPGVVLDGRADLYAVGVMLYNMLTGTIPRGAFRMPSITLKTDARFDKIILKAMEMDRENRYQTALDLRRALDVILTTPAAKTASQPLPAQQAALPQKPMGKSPSAPQQRPAAGAATPGRTAPAAGKPATIPPAAPAKKSNAGMIYGIAAAVVVAGGAFMFSGIGKNPAPAPKTVAEKKPEPKNPESRPATLPPAAAKPKPTEPKPAEPKPAPVPATLAAGKEKWVDGLAQWFGGTQTHKAFVRESNGAARIGTSSATLKPIPLSAPKFSDQVVRMRWHGTNPKTELRVYVRLAAEASGKGYSAGVKASKDGSWEVHLEGPRGTIGNRARALPADFKPEATHIMEFRVIGDRLTATFDGQKIVEVPDTQLISGHPAFSGHDAIIESFEYANLDPGGAAPSTPVATKDKPADVLTFGGHRYQLVMEKHGWDAAKAHAESMDGHLATITSKEENEWLQKNVVVPKGTDNHVFLGGAKLKSTGVWTWVTGEPVDLDLWGGKGPDGSGPALTFQSGGKQWDDVGTSSAYTFLVEWDDDSPAKPAPVASTAPAAAPLPAVAPTMPAAAPASAPASAPAAPVAPADPRLAQLAAGFKARHEAAALQPFNTAVAALNTSYVANGVSRARTAAKAKGSLAEVTALDAEKSAIEQGRGVPGEDDPDTVEALKTLRSTYRTAHAKLAAERDARAAPLYDLYLNALDAYIAELTQADKIADARRVQVFRDDIALQKPGAGAAIAPATVKGTTSAPAPSAAAKPTVRAPKMSEHELAEWAIATGGNVEVLAGTPPAYQKIAVASELPRGRFVITTMAVNCEKVPGKDLSPLASAQDVGRLNFENILLADKTSIDLTPLRQMPKLRTLGTRNLDAAAVEVIASLEVLDTLYAGSMPEGSLEKIAKLKQLVTFESPAIIGPGIAELKSCKVLRNIKCTDSAFSDDDARVLAAALPNLDKLDISGSSAITNACLPSLLTLKSLKLLALHSNELDDSVMEPLSKLPNLADLRLNSTKIIGSNINILKKFDSLRDLYLDGCSVTDEALEVLVHMKALTKLQLRGTKVTDAGIAKFKAARPGFNISK